MTCHVINSNRCRVRVLIVTNNDNKASAISDNDSLSQIESDHIGHFRHKNPVKNDRIYTVPIEFKESGHLIKTIVFNRNT